MNVKKERGRENEDDQIDYDDREFCVVSTQSKGSNFFLFTQPLHRHTNEEISQLGITNKPKFASPHNVTKHSCENVLADVVAKKRKEEKKGKKGRRK